MSRTKKYFFGRVHKLGILNDEQLVHAIRQPSVIKVGNYNWSFIDAHVEYAGEEVKYVFAKMCKYLPQGEVPVVDDIGMTQSSLESENLIQAVSPFIYLPEHSCVVYQLVWNQIPRDVFLRRFSSLVMDALKDQVMIACEVEPISSLQKFTTSLMEFDNLCEIRVRVSPPNPFYGRLWKRLEQFLIDRKASEFAITEKAHPGQYLNSALQDTLHAMSETGEFPRHDLGVTDAAIFMALDGYGKGKILGIREGEPEILETSGSPISLEVEDGISHYTLYHLADIELRKIIEERQMESLK